MKNLIEELRACAKMHPLDIDLDVLLEAAEALENQALESVPSFQDLSAKSGTALMGGPVMPTSAGDETNYPPCDYCAAHINYHPWHGSGLINGVESRHIHACDDCRHKLPGTVDTRAAPSAGSQEQGE